jgi:hypothetical protein
MSISPVAVAASITAGTAAARLATNVVAKGVDFASVLAGTGVARSIEDADGRAERGSLLDTLKGDRFPSSPAALRSEIDSLTQRIQQKLASAAQLLPGGVIQPFELRVGSTGEILVNDDHPRKAAIERLFADDPELANGVRQISAMSSLLAAIKRHEEFARLYEIDPVAAATQHLGKQSQVESLAFRLSFDALTPQG